MFLAHRPCDEKSKCTLLQSPHVSFTLLASYVQTRKTNAHSAHLLRNNPLRTDKLFRYRGYRKADKATIHKADQLCMQTSACRANNLLAQVECLRAISS